MAQLQTTALDPALDQLQEEHATLEARQRELERQRSLSPEERYELLVIKKRKLALKDRLTRPE